MGAGDLPAGDEPSFEVPENRVEHAALTFGDGELLASVDDVLRWYPAGVPGPASTEEIYDD